MASRGIRGVRPPTAVWQHELAREGDERAHVEMAVRGHGVCSTGRGVTSMVCVHKCALCTYDVQNLHRWVRRRGEARVVAVGKDVAHSLMM